MNFPYLISLPLVTQATNLHNSIALFDYRLANLDILIDRGNYYPILCINRPFKDDFDIELTDGELAEFEDLNEDNKVIFANNKNFYDRLHLEMHTLENGMIF